MIEILAAVLIVWLAWWLSGQLARMFDKLDDL